MTATPYITVGSLLLDQEAGGVRWTVKPNGGLVGWDGVASTIALTAKPRQDGSWAGNAFLAPRHVSITGRIVAPDEAALWDARDRLTQACGLAETTLTVTESGRSRWATVRREGDVIVTNVTATLADYSVQLVAADPRRFGTALSGSTALPATSGGLTVPFTAPFAVASTVVAGQVALTNPGNYNGPVSLRIDGPCTGPVITHVGSGLALTFSSSLVLGAGEWLDVDMEKRTALANGQSSRNGWITGRGWSQFEPGGNIWAFTAAGYDAGSLLTVTATPAWQ